MPLRKNVGIACVALLTAAGSAGAADLGRPVYSPPVAPPVMVHNWTGLYAGFNLGGVWADSRIRSTATGVSTNLRDSDFIVGAQIGYNYQFMGGFILGVEADFDVTGGGRNGQVVATPFGNMHASLDGPAWLTTLAGRIGYAWDRWMLYGKVGGGWVSAEAKFHNLTTGATATTDKMLTAWMLGIGTEYAWTPNWSTKFEYDYLSSGNWSATDVMVAGGRAEVSSTLHLFKVGMNYKF